MEIIYSYIFGRIDDWTNRMIEVFLTGWQPGRRINTFDGKDLSLIEAVVVSSLSASVNAVLARCGNANCNQSTGAKVAAFHDRPVAPGLERAAQVGRQDAVLPNS